jgi:hypothetical protein
MAISRRVQRKRLPAHRRHARVHISHLHAADEGLPTSLPTTMADKVEMTR